MKKYNSVLILSVLAALAIGSSNAVAGKIGPKQMPDGMGSITAPLPDAKVGPKQTPDGKIGPKQTPDGNSVLLWFMSLLLGR